MRRLYLAIIAVAIISSMAVLAVSAENSDAADDSATLVCYIDDATDNGFSYRGNVEVKAYLLTGTSGSTSLDDYTVISSSTNIGDANNIKKIVLSGIDASTPIDASKVFLCFDIENYTVGTIQTEFFDMSKKVQITDSDSKRIFTFYNIGSKFTTIENGTTYYIGNDDRITTGVDFIFAEGTITGTVTAEDGMKIAGAEVSVTDSVRGLTKTVTTDTDGAYSVKFYTGDYKLKIIATHYRSETPDVHIYDDLSYDASKNKQAAVKLTAESDSAAIIGYISNTNGTDFEKVTNIDISLYYQKGTEYELLSSTKEIKTDKTKDGSVYYYFELSDIPYKSVSNCYIYLNMTGYSVGMVQTACIDPEPHTLVIGQSTYVAYKFNESMFTTGYFEPGSTYKLGSDTMPGIQMKSAKGTITGKVTTNTSTPAALNGVTVSIYDTKTDALIASGITYDNGSYSIVCSTGYYKITASINDYKTYTGYITIYDDQYNPELNIQPDIRLSPSEAIFGTDLPHVLMIMGVIVALILIIIAIIHRLKFFGKKLDIYDDEKEEKEE